MEAISERWMFLIYGLILAIFCTVVIFYHVRWTGKLVGFFLCRYVWNRWKCHIKVGSLKFSLLSGTILFRNVRFYSENMSLCVLEGYVIFRYWRRDVRSIDSDDETVPARFEVHLNGFEWFMYNRTGAYELLRYSRNFGLEPDNCMGKASLPSEIPLNAKLDSSEVSPKSDWITRFIRWLPVRVQCGKGSITIGNESLGTLVVMQFLSAQGWESIKKVANNTIPSETHLYLRTHIYHFRNLIVRFCDTSEPSEINVDESKSNLSKYPQAGISSLDERNLGDRDAFYSPDGHFITSSRKFTRSSHSMSGIANLSARNKDGAKNSLDIAGTSRPLSSFPSVESFRPGNTRIFGQRGRRQESSHEKFNAKEDFDLETQEFISETRWKRVHTIEYAKVDELIEAPSAILEYCYEIYFEDPKREVDSDIASDKELKYSLNFHLDQGTVNYGPWAERQRLRIIEFFFPRTFEDDREGSASPAESIYKNLSLNFYFNGPSVFRIPMREFSQDWRYQSLPIKSWKTRDFGWIDLKLHEESSIYFVIPLQPHQGHNEFKFGINAGRTNVLTSINFANFASWRKFDLQAILKSPLKWNGERNWNIQIGIDGLESFLMRDHLYLLTDLTRDWSWKPTPPTLENHIPCLYRCTILFDNINVFFYVNECNIIDFPNEPTENNIFSLKSQETSCQISYDARCFQPDRNRYDYDISVLKFIAEAHFAASHTVGSHLEPSSTQFLESDFLRLHGYYSFSNSATEPKNIDLLKLVIHGSQTSGTLYGFIVRYLLISKNNFVGAFENFSTSEEYRARRDDSSVKAEQDENIKSKDIFLVHTTSPLEVWVDFHLNSSSLFLPSELYNRGSPLTLYLPSISISITNSHLYQDFVLRIPIAHLTGDPGKFDAEKPDCLTFYDCTLESARLYGPRSKALSYVSRWKFLIDRFLGHIELSSLIKLASSIDFFLFHFSNAEDYIEVLSSDQVDLVPTQASLQLREACFFVLCPSCTVRVSVSSGCSAYSDSLMRSHHNFMIGLQLPQLLIQCLSRLTGLNQVAETLTTPIISINARQKLTFFNRSKNFDSLFQAQQAYIRDQDQETGRCTFLYGDPNALVLQNPWSFFPLQTPSAWDSRRVFLNIGKIWRVNWLHNASTITFRDGLLRFGSFRSDLEWTIEKSLVNLSASNLYRHPTLCDFSMSASTVNTYFIYSLSSQVERQILDRFPARISSYVIERKDENQVSSVPYPESLQEDHPFKDVRDDFEDVSLLILNAFLNRPIVIEAPIWDLLPSLISAYFESKSTVELLFDEWYVGYIRYLVDLYRNGSRQLELLINVEKPIIFLDFDLDSSIHQSVEGSCGLVIHLERLCLRYQKLTKIPDSLYYTESYGSEIMRDDDFETFDASGSESSVINLRSTSRKRFSKEIDLFTFEVFPDCSLNLLVFSSNEDRSKHLDFLRRSEDFIANEDLISRSDVMCRFDGVKFFMQNFSGGSDFEDSPTRFINASTTRITFEVNIDALPAKIIDNLSFRYENSVKKLFWVLKRSGLIHQRLLQETILEVTKVSSIDDVSLDPMFLTRPSAIWRLGNRPFQEETGWRLIHHLRSHYAYWKNAGTDSKQIDIPIDVSKTYESDSIDMTAYWLFVNDAFATVVKALSNWRYWEMGDVYRCDLVLHLFSGSRISQSIRHLEHPTEPGSIFRSQSVFFSHYNIISEHVSISARSQRSLSNLNLDIDRVLLTQTRSVLDGADYDSNPEFAPTALHFRVPSKIHDIALAKCANSRNGLRDSTLVRIGPFVTHFHIKSPDALLKQLLQIFGFSLSCDSVNTNRQVATKTALSCKIQKSTGTSRDSLSDSIQELSGDSKAHNYVVITDSCVAHLSLTGLSTLAKITKLVVVGRTTSEQDHEILMDASDPREEGKKDSDKERIRLTPIFSVLSLILEQARLQITTNSSLCPSQDSSIWDESLAIDLSIGQWIYSSVNVHPTLTCSDLIGVSIRVNLTNSEDLLINLKQIRENLKYFWPLALSNQGPEFFPFLSSVSHEKKDSTKKVPETLRSQLFCFSEFELVLANSCLNTISKYNCVGPYFRHRIVHHSIDLEIRNEIEVDLYRHRLTLGKSSFDLPAASTQIDASKFFYSHKTGDCIGLSPHSSGFSPKQGLHVAMSDEPIFQTSPCKSTISFPQNQCCFVIEPIKFNLSDSQIIQMITFLESSKEIFAKLINIMKKNSEEETVVSGSSGELPVWKFQFFIRGLHILFILKSTSLVMDLLPCSFFYVVNSPKEVPKSSPNPSISSSSIINFHFAVWRQTSVALHAYKLRKVLTTNLHMNFGGTGDTLKNHFSLHIATFLVYIYPCSTASYGGIMEDLEMLFPSTGKSFHDLFRFFSKREDEQPNPFFTTSERFENISVEAILDECLLVLLLQDEIYDQYGEDINFHLELVRSSPSLPRRASALIGFVEHLQISNLHAINIYCLKFQSFSIVLLENYDSRSNIRSYLKNLTGTSTITSSPPKSFISLSFLEVTTTIMSQFKWISCVGVVRKYDGVLDSRFAGNLRRFVVVWLAAKRKPLEATLETPKEDQVAKKINIMGTWSISFFFECIPGSLKLLAGEHSASPSIPNKQVETAVCEWLFPNVRLAIVYQTTSQSNDSSEGKIDLFFVPQKNTVDPTFVLFLNECLRNYEKTTAVHLEPPSTPQSLSSRLASISKENWYSPFRQGSWYVALHVQEQDVELNCGHLGRVSCNFRIAPCKLLLSLIPEDVSGYHHVVGSFILPDLNLRLGHSFASDGCFKAQLQQFICYFDHPIETWGDGCTPTRVFVLLDSFKTAINARYFHDIHIFRRVWFRRSRRDVSFVNEGPSLVSSGLYLGSKGPSFARPSPSTPHSRIKSYYIPSSYESPESAKIHTPILKHPRPNPVQSIAPESPLSDRRGDREPLASKFVSGRSTMGMDDITGRTSAGFIPLSSSPSGSRSKSVHLSEEYRELSRVHGPTSTSKEMLLMNFVCSDASGELDLSQILGKMQFTSHQSYGRFQTPLTSGYSQFEFCAERTTAESKGRIGLAATIDHLLLTGKLCKGQLRFSLNSYNRLCDIFGQLRHFSFCIEYPIEKVFILDLDIWRCFSRDQWRCDSLMDISGISVDSGLDIGTLRILLTKDTAPALSFIRKCFQRLLKYRAPSTSHLGLKRSTRTSLTQDDDSEASSSTNHSNNSEMNSKSLDKTIVQEDQRALLGPHALGDLITYSVLVCRNHFLLPISHLRVNINEVSCGLYSTLADSDWACIKIGEFFLRLNESSHQLPSNMGFSSHKDTLLHMKRMEISKCRNDRVSAKMKRNMPDNQLMDHTFAFSSSFSQSTGGSLTVITVIAELPSTIVTMETDQIFTTADVDYHFAADFDDAIYVKLNIGMFHFLRDLSQTYIRTYRREFLEEYSHRLDPTSTSQSETTPSDTARMNGDLLFHAMGPIQFDPRLRALGEATPRIEKIFEWLGIDRETLPKCLHRGLTIPIIHGLWRINRHIMHRFVPLDNFVSENPADRHHASFVNDPQTSPLLYASSMDHILGFNFRT